MRRSGNLRTRRSGGARTAERTERSVSLTSPGSFAVTAASLVSWRSPFIFVRISRLGGTREVSCEYLVCMLFLDVPGSSTTPRPASARDSVASTDIAFPLSKQGRHAVRQLSGLNRPAHRCLCLRFAVRLATHHARLEAGIESLLLSRRALSSPTTCRFIPAHLLASIARLRFTGTRRLTCDSQV